MFFPCRGDSSLSAKHTSDLSSTAFLILCTSFGSHLAALLKHLTDEASHLTFFEDGDHVNFNSSTTWLVLKTQNKTPCICVSLCMCKKNRNIKNKYLFGLALERLQQENFKFEDSLSYRVRFHHKKTLKIKNKE